MGMRSGRRKSERLTPEQKARLRKLASYATNANLGIRFGIAERRVEEILRECPDCEICGCAAPMGDNICQRCLEKEVIDEYGRKRYL